MKTISIVFSDSSSHELRDIDHLGRYILKEESTRFGVLIPVSFRLDGRSLNACLEVWIDKAGLPNEHQRESILAFVAKTYPGYLAKHKELDVFQAINYLPIIGKKAIQEVKKKSFETKVEINISEELYDCLNEQQTKDKAARDAFDTARETLYDFACNLTSYGFEDSADDIRDLLRYISSCLTSSESLFLAGWNSEKLPSLKHSFEELITRTVENNRNYKYAQGKAREIAYALRPPHSWYGEPPSPKMIEHVLAKHSR